MNIDVHRLPFGSISMSCVISMIPLAAYSREVWMRDWCRRGALPVDGGVASPLMPEIGYSLHIQPLHSGVLWPTPRDSALRLQGVDDAAH